MTVEELKKYKDGLYSSLSRELDAFEKNFILISSGILAFSITFIKEIVKIECAHYLWILFVAWGFILISVALMMFAFLSSVDASNELWKTVDDYILQEKLLDSTIRLRESQALFIKNTTRTILFSRKKFLKRLRYSAIVIFTLGIVAFSSFVGINLYRENTKKAAITVKNPKRSVINIKTEKTDTTTTDSVITLIH